MAMDHPKISIITTVYKTGHYLPLTVQSILAQTFTDFELLLVDDGSPDNSGEVADALAKTDARIRVFHKENGGPASASNMGLDNSRGDYIGFVDSDDLIAPDMYEKLYAAVQAPGVRLPPARAIASTRTAAKLRAASSPVTCGACMTPRSFYWMRLRPAAFTGR